MNALTAIKALIMKSRPAYKDYLGKATKIVKIYEGALPEDGSSIEANCLDPNFEGFVTGEYYDVVIDGEQKKCLGFLSDDKCCIGCADSLEEIQQLLSEENPNVWYAVILINGTITLCAIGSFANKSITISKTVSEEKYDIKKLPEECLPDSVGKKINTVSTAITKLQSLVNDTESMANEALSTAQDAQHNISTTNNIANAAKSTAETAKSTAETAKSTAEAAQSTAETAKTTAEAAQTTADAALPKSGGTMTGKLILHSAEPTEKFQAVSKYYVDDQICWTNTTNMSSCDENDNALGNVRVKITSVGNIGSFFINTVIPSKSEAAYYRISTGPFFPPYTRMENISNGHICGIVFDMSSNNSNNSTNGQRIGIAIKQFNRIHIVLDDDYKNAGYMSLLFMVIFCTV